MIVRCKIKNKTVEKKKNNLIIVVEKTFETENES